ncbi:MAG: hypothetical protein K0R86_2355 [Enterobacter kobei]|nr:hypothetical protein [Enterobacter kobei]
MMLKKTGAEKRRCELYHFNDRSRMSIIGFAKPSPSDGEGFSLD